MAGTDKTTKQPVTTLSQKFILRERQVKLTISQETPTGSFPDSTVGVGDAWERVKWRFVYVFQMLGTDITWIGEYWVDDNGSYYPYDMSKATDKAGKPTKERQDRQPLLDPMNAENRHEYLELHHTINGKRANHAFYLSNARLPLSSLKKLVTPEYYALLWAYHLGDDKIYHVTDMFTTDPGTSGSEDLRLPEFPGYPNIGSHEIYIRVYDPLLLAMSLNGVMQGLRDLELAWLIPAENANVKDKNADAQRRKRTEQRQKLRLLSGMIKALLDNEQTKDKVSNELQTMELNHWWDHYEQTSKKLHDDVATWAAKLTEWMGLRPFQFMVESHLALIIADPDNCVDDLTRFMMGYADCTARLMESQPGRDWIDKLVADKSHFVHSWVIDTAKPPRQYVKVFEKAAKAFFGIFRDVFISYRKMYGVGSTTVTPLYGTIWARSVDIPFSHARYIDETSGHLVEISTDAQIRRHIEEGPLPPEVVPNAIKGPAAQKPHDPNSTGDDVTGQEEAADQAAEELEARIVHWENTHTVKEVTQTRTEERTPQEPNWSSEISEDAVASIMRARAAFQQSMAVLNSAMALYDLRDQGVNTKTLLNAVNALGKTVTAFRLKSLGPLELSTATLETIGFFTALLDYYNSLDSARNEKRAGHATAYAGYLIAGIGSGVVAVGTFLAIFGAATPLTWMGLVLIAVGTIIVMFGGSTPLQDFMNHCSWGKSYYPDHVESGIAKWSEGDFSGWHEKNADGLDRQIKALFNVLRSFRLIGDTGRLSIEYGLPPAKINVICQYEIRSGSMRRLSYYHVDVSNRTTRLHAEFMSLYKFKDVNGPQDWSDWEEDSVNPVIEDLIHVDYSPNNVTLRFKFKDSVTGEITKDGIEPDCWVRLDIQGDEKEFYPPSGAYIPCEWPHEVKPIRFTNKEVKTVDSLDYLDK